MSGAGWKNGVHNDPVAKKGADPFRETAPPEPLPGLEPGTYALRMRCSTN